MQPDNGRIACVFVLDDADWRPLGEFWLRASFVCRLVSRSLLIRPPRPTKSCVSRLVSRSLIRQTAHQKKTPQQKTILFCFATALDASGEASWMRLEFSLDYEKSSTEAVARLEVTNCDSGANEYTAVLRRAKPATQTDVTYDETC